MALGKSKPRKGHNGANRSYKRSVMDLKNRGRDIDRIQDDIKKVLDGKELPGVVDEDVPGGGLHYCVPCARHFSSDIVLRLHMRSKPHKKRLKLVAEEQYTHKEADAGAGCSGRDTDK